MRPLLLSYHTDVYKINKAGLKRVLVLVIIRVLNVVVFIPGFPLVILSQNKGQLAKRM
jgi:hypothetical protein